MHCFVYHSAQTKTEMIHTAKAIAANGQTIVRFANLLSDQCMDRRIKADLLHCSEMIPTLSTQLRIIASVKASTPDDTSVSYIHNCGRGELYIYYR